MNETTITKHSKLYAKVFYVIDVIITIKKYKIRRDLLRVKKLDL